MSNVNEFDSRYDEMKGRHEQECKELASEFMKMRNACIARDHRGPDGKDYRKECFFYFDWECTSCGEVK